MFSDLEVYPDEWFNDAAPAFTMVPKKIFKCCTTRQIVIFRRHFSLLLQDPQQHVATYSSGATLYRVYDKVHLFSVLFSLQYNFSILGFRQKYLLHTLKGQCTCFMRLLVKALQLVSPPTPQSPRYYINIICTRE
jgi:hypothetical protein